MSIPGEYSVIYSVKDRAGNQAQKKVRVVKVLDTEGPILTIKGDSIVELEAGAEYVEFGVVATDRVEGDVSASVKSLGNVNASVVGVYNIIYVAQDSRGNESESVIRQVAVVDTTPPVVPRIEPLEVQEEKCSELMCCQ